LIFMGSSLFSSNSHSQLRRVSGWIIATTGVLTLLLQIVLAQRPQREAADKGPRAMGLVEFSANGKAHLIPITIMVDGKFYDASAYKASPVPIALESGTVYEAVQTGVSQGLFTVSSALARTTTWLGEGNWQSAAEIQAEAAKKKARAAAKPVKKNDDQDAPPVLRRAGPGKAGPDKSEPDKSQSDKPVSDKSGSSDKSASDKSQTPAPAAIPAGSASPTAGGSPASTATPAVAASAQVPSPSSSSDEDDPDRPHLRRDKVPSSPKAEKTVIAAKVPAANPPIAASTLVPPPSTPTPELQMIPAISDAGGPEPRPYAFVMKLDEERQFRTKMLALAAADVVARAKAVGSGIVSTPATPAPVRKGKTQTPTEPAFENVQLRVFDLSNSNEPVLILTTKAHLASRAADNEGPAVDYLVTFVAREDIYGDLHKAFSNVTDNLHLDVLPRLDLIDAVDIDGDGRGELLFRQVYDRGNAYVVYRVIGNQLWPLFQGSIG
jgi:hypothetical protein